MIQRKFRKVPDFVYRDERLRTEGGSDDEHIQQRWRELLKNDSLEDITQEGCQIKVEDQEEESDQENDNPETAEERRQFMQSFFQKRQSVINNDLVNVFIPEADEENEGDDLDDFDMNEKYRDETLKMSSHGTAAPKTIMSLQEKFKSPTHASEKRFEFPVKGSYQHERKENIPSNRQSIKMSGKVNPQAVLKQTENMKGNGTSRRESACSRNFNEMDFSENLKEVQMKKLVKYTMKKQNLMSRLNQQQKKVVKDESFGNKLQPQLHNNAQPQSKVDEPPLVPRTSKKIKHERIKSLEFPNKVNFETFFDSLWKQTEKDER